LVSTPIASIPVRSTPLIRYKAPRVGYCPRRRSALCFAAFPTGGSGFSAEFLLLHIRQFAENLLLVIGDPLLDGVKHLESLLQAEYIVLPPVVRLTARRFPSRFFYNSLNTRPV
jgi:hypothetical protein